MSSKLSSKCAKVTAIGVVLLSLVSHVLCFDGCRFSYGRRGCEDRIHEGVVVTCNGDGEESSIPTTIPSDTVYISLVNFDLGYLQRANFTRFPLVECFNILNSKIAGIDYDTFADMSSLHELNMRGSRMTGEHLRFLAHPDFTATVVTVSNSLNIAEVDFEIPETLTLENLVSLKLEDNNIRRVSSEILKELEEVRTISLSRNNIESLDWRMLRRLISLNELYLDDNQLQTIPEEASTVFYAVNELRLGNNPLHCNCKLLWLKDFYTMATDKELDFQNVACVSPFKKGLMDVTTEELQCSDPTVPALNFIELPEGRVAVNCSSRSDPAPTLTLTFGDGRQLISPPPADLSQLYTSTPYILIEEPGRVTCKATNSEGVSQVTLASPGSGIKTLFHHFVSLVSFHLCMAVFCLIISC